MCPLALVLCDLITSDMEGGLLRRLLLLLLPASAATTLEFIPPTATALADGIWMDNLLSVTEAEEMREHVLDLPAYPCPLQEQTWPKKQCTKVPMGSTVAARLAAVICSVARFLSTSGRRVLLRTRPASTGLDVS